VASIIRNRPEVTISKIGVKLFSFQLPEKNIYFFELTVHT